MSRTAPSGPSASTPFSMKVARRSWERSTASTTRPLTQRSMSPRNAASPTSARRARSSRSTTHAAVSERGPARSATRAAWSAAGHRRRRPPAEELGEPDAHAAGRRRRELARDPPPESQREPLEVLAHHALGAAREQPREVHPLDLLRHVLAREDAAAHHRADARRHQLPVGRDQGRVRDRQPEWATEDRGDREPVGKATHDPRLGDREDPATPPAAPERERERRERAGAEEHAERETPLAPHLSQATLGCPGARRPRDKRRDGRRSRLCLTSHTPRGVSRTAGRKSAERTNSVRRGSWCE